ncbi:hypothetical protein [Jiangella muralis]|uniref:hypothetical protein n=1 Tax=Jiangella muralis TaxID=702383 RepID=UPI001969EBE7|nr:hypothetical protein [Jiangella muralis]
MGAVVDPGTKSLDGYIEDPHGRLDWSVPDAEVPAVVNDLLRPIGTHLSGRRLDEVMAVAEDDDTVRDLPE